MTAQPKVSVILTVYNMQACLRETLDCVFAQTYENLEVIVVDDGSSDDSLSIIKEYAATDRRVKFRTRRNAGQGVSRNEGLDLASGDYVLMLDSDDIYDVRMVERMVERAVEADADIVVCRTAEFEDGSSEIVETPWTAKAEQLPAHDPFSWRDMADFAFTAFIGWPWDKLYKRSFLQAHNLRFPEMENSEDLYFVFFSLVLAERISVVDDVLAFHRIGRKGSVSNSRMIAPLAFYDGICMLKNALRERPQDYAELEWGFLNWAFNYAIWNIESLPASTVRSEVAEQFVHGKLVELELDKHCRSYFASFDTDLQRFDALLREVDGEDAVTTEEHVCAHPKAGYAAAFFTEAQLNGFGRAFGKAGAKVAGRSRTEQTAADPTARGGAFFVHS